MTSIVIAIALSLAVGAFLYLLVDGILRHRRGDDLVVRVSDVAPERRGGLTFFSKTLTRYTGLRVELALMLVVGSWLAALTGLQLLAGNELLAVILSIPASILAGFGYMRWQAAKRKAKFESQFVRFVERLATQMGEGGQSLPDAIKRLTLAQPEEPIASELRAMLRDLEANIPPSRTAGHIHNRYNTPATKQFWLTLAIHDQEGGVQLVELLNTLAAQLKAELRLRREALTDITQTKFEGYAMCVLTVVIIMTQVFGNQQVLAAMVQELIWQIVFGLLLANLVVGFVRVRRAVSRATRGDF